jgi:hypothetical protein
MLREALCGLHVPSQAEIEASNRRRQRRSAEPLPEHAFFEAEAARARRELRVFTLTAAQPALDRVDNAVCHAAAAVGWRLAEGTATTEEVAATTLGLRDEYEAAIEVTRPYYVTPPEMSALPRLVRVLGFLFIAPVGDRFSAPYDAAHCLVVPEPFFASGVPVPLLTPEETSACPRLIREIFGTRRFGKVAPHWRAEWVTDTALSLARQMYESREFSAMPILADALQDAGCDNDDILNHCRAPGAHVRGCWVCDLVLGKV